MNTLLRLDSNTIVDIERITFISVIPETGQVIVGLDNCGHDELFYIDKEVTVDDIWKVILKVKGVISSDNIEEEIDNDEFPYNQGEN